MPAYSAGSSPNTHPRTFCMSAIENDLMVPDFPSLFLLSVSLHTLFPSPKTVLSTPCLDNVHPSRLKKFTSFKKEFS